MQRLSLMMAVIWGMSFLPGCAHTQLRWNTTHQANTLTDIFEQQVLDNLAMFVHDPDALPSFAYPNQGGADVTDNGSIGSDTSWNRLGFSTEVLKLSASRNMKEAWTLTPVYDVRRLELMRCAYQHALFCAGLSGSMKVCPDCDKIQRTFYLGDYTSKYDDNPAENSLATFSRKTGRTTPACFEAVAWLACGERKCLPKNCKCVKMGHYCGTYVWVVSGGQDELTKLTFTILDYAFSPQAPKSNRTKEVTWYIGENGLPVIRENAAQEIKAIVPFSDKVRLKTEGAELPANATDAQRTAAEELKKRGEEIDDAFKDLPTPSYSLPPIMQPPSGFSPLQFELNRQFLTPQSTPTP